LIQNAATAEVGGSFEFFEAAARARGKKREGEELPTPPPFQCQLKKQYSFPARVSSPCLKPGPAAEKRARSRSNLTAVHK